MNQRPFKAKKPVPVASFIMRRVYMQGNFYHCGICKKAHRTGEDAQACLRSCWQSLLAKAPWTEVSRFGKTEFHCTFCHRSYATAEQANQCAKDCSEKLSISALDQTGLVVKRVKRVFMKTEKPQPMFPFKIPGKEHLMPPPKAGKKPATHSGDAPTAEAGEEKKPDEHAEHAESAPPPEAHATASEASEKPSHEEKPAEPPKTAEHKH